MTSTPTGRRVTIDGLDSIAFDRTFRAGCQGRLGGGHRAGPAGPMDRRMDRRSIDRIG